jgi:hypothetical protein
MQSTSRKTTTHPNLIFRMYFISHLDAIYEEELREEFEND